MTDFKERCTCIKLFFQIGKIGAETFQVLTFAFREEAMRQTVAFDCSAESRNSFLKYMVCSNLMLIWVSYIVSDHHLVAVVLQETNLKMGPNLSLKCVMFQYV